MNLCNLNIVQQDYFWFGSVKFEIYKGLKQGMIDFMLQFPQQTIYSEINEIFSIGFSSL